MAFGFGGGREWVCGPRTQGCRRNSPASSRVLALKALQLLLDCRDFQTLRVVASGACHILHLFLLECLFSAHPHLLCCVSVLA